MKSCFCHAEIQRISTGSYCIYFWKIWKAQHNSIWIRSQRDDVETLLGMAEPGRVQSRLSTVSIYLSKLVVAQQQRLLGNVYTPLECVPSLSNLVYVMYYASFNTILRLQGIQTQTIRSLHPWSTWSFTFFFKNLLNMATKKREREFKTTCLAFLLHFPPPSFSFHALLPKIHIEIDRECLIFRPQPPTSEGYSIESNCLTKKKKKPIITIQL